MFETAEVGNRLSKEAYKAQVPEVRAALLEAQKALAQSGLAVVVHIGGVEGAGKTEAVNHLLEWMDARGIEIHAMGDPTDEERERPPMWRFWRRLPPKGRMAIFLGSWYTDPIVNRAFGKTDEAELDRDLERISAFEHMLSAEGVLLVKCWLHITKDLQHDRLKKLSKDPLQSWRVTKRDWRFAKRYDTFRRVSETALMRTSTAEAPWHIVEAADPRYRDLQVARILLKALNERLGAAKTPVAPAKPDRPKPPVPNIIRSLDLTRSLSDKAYDKRLPKATAEVGLLTRRLYEKKRSLILVFEGPDAAGKGGAIRRLTAAMDARNYRHIAVSAPTEEERAHPYLWRFWRNLPRLGRVTIYDRSWYGRVLVERIEGFCHHEEWERAYTEINAFEEELTDFGILLVKFWLAISPQEQLRRFKEREETPYKTYKITAEDWRNRSKWNAYEAAAVQMVERTSTSWAPWILVEAEDKNHARVKVLETVAEHLSKGLHGKR